MATPPRNAKCLASANHGASHCRFGCRQCPPYALRKAVQNCTQGSLANALAGWWALHKKSHRQSAIANTQPAGCFTSSEKMATCSSDSLFLGFWTKLMAIWMYGAMPDGEQCCRYRGRESSVMGEP